MGRASLPKEYVLDLRLAEHQFLQVLVSSFRLTRQGRGVRLEVGIDDDGPAIWTRQAKTALRSQMPDFQAKSDRYQAQIDEFLLKGIGQEFRFNDPDFYFRYASGGTLPIVRRGAKDYYCLFYRNARPIGWNLANGGRSRK